MNRSTHSDLSATSRSRLAGLAAILLLPLGCLTGCGGEDDGDAPDLSPEAVEADQTGQAGMEEFMKSGGAPSQ